MSGRKTNKEPEAIVAEVVGDEETALVPAGRAAPPMGSHAINAEVLVTKALEHNASMETIERLVALQERMREQWARSQFFESLAAFQAEVPPIARSKAVKEKSGQGTRYHYAPYEDIVRTIGPYLDRHGFSHTEDTEMMPMSKEEAANWGKSKGWLIATCSVHHRGGHTKTSTFRVPIGSDFMTIQQEFGAASTFAKRYAILNALGLATGGEDTDGVMPRPKGGGSDHRYREPTPKSERQPAPEVKQDDELKPSAASEYPSIKAAASDAGRIQPSNLKTLQANMKRLKIGDDDFQRAFGFPLEQMDKHGLNELLDWMKKTGG